MKEKFSTEIFSAQEYDKDPDENWNLRPDVAGYEYAEEISNWRIGIVRDVIDSSGHLDAIEDILKAPFKEDCTRNMARVVLTEDLLRNPPPELQRVLPDLESLISLKGSGNPDLADCYQAIFSRNAETRRTPKEVMEKELADATRAFHSGAAKRESGAEISLPEGMSLQRITHESDPQILQSFVELTSVAFSETEDDLHGLLEDEDTIIKVVVRDEGDKRIVIGSVYAMRDADALKRNGKDVDLNTFEIMGAKVREDMQGRGVYKALQKSLLQSLAKIDGVDVVFGYSNATNLSVFSVAGQMGRTLVSDTAVELGLSIRPAMKQTVTDGELVDEIVSYIPGNTLRQLY